MAASIIAKLLQAGTAQGQRAAVALARKLLRQGASSDIVRPRAFIRKVGTKRSMPKGYKYREVMPPKFKVPEPGVPMERARAIDRLREAASHGFPKGVKNTAGGMTAGRFPMSTIPNRMKSRESIMSMRRDPGMARGLQRMESRKASALNTAGRPRQYEPSPVNTFTNLMRTDKGFKRFVLDQVGPEKASTVLLNPEIRRRLISDYLRTVRKGVDNFPSHPDMGTPATIDDIMKMFKFDFKGAKKIDDAWAKRLAELYEG